MRERGIESDRVGSGAGRSRVYESSLVASRSSKGMATFRTDVLLDSLALHVSGHIVSISRQASYVLCQLDL